MIRHETDERATLDDSSDLTPKIDSIAIQRMIEEVRSGEAIGTPASYNRTHNKHNR
jgi:hypothetical protein